MTRTFRGVAAGVPYVATPPHPAGRESPIVIAWHLMDPPRTEDAFAAALPLDGLDAWRIYLALPMSAHRLPEGGEQSVMEAGMADAVRLLKVPVVDGAAEEFPAVFAALRDQVGLGTGPLGLLGGSDGSAAAAQVALRTAEAGIDVAALALVSPVSRMKDIVDAVAAMFEFSYPWDEETLAIAARHDLVARAGELARAVPAIRLVVGSEDDEAGVVGPARQLAAALESAAERGTSVRLDVIDGMGHALAEEPGIEPAPQTNDAARVDRLLADWFATQLR